MEYTFIVYPDTTGKPLPANQQNLYANPKEQRVVSSESGLLRDINLPIGLSDNAKCNYNTSQFPTGDVCTRYLENEYKELVGSKPKLNNPCPAGSSDKKSKLYTRMSIIGPKALRKRKNSFKA